MPKRLIKTGIKITSSATNLNDKKEANIKKDREKGFTLSQLMTKYHIGSTRLNRILTRTPIKRNQKTAPAVEVGDL